MILTYRKANIEDIDILYDWYSDDEVKKQMYSPPEDRTDFIKYILKDYRYIVTLNTTPVGTFTLDVSKLTANVGMLIAKEYRGMGYGKSIGKLIDAECNAIGIRTVTADIYSNNEAAINCIKQYGLREFIWFEKNL